MLVHPKDKLDPMEASDVVYCIPCASCDRSHIGETGRINEHRKEVDSLGEKRFTRSKRLSSLTEVNKSAVTDHASQHNHAIDWDNVEVVDKESTRFTRWVKEAIWIRKTESFKLSHVWDQSLAATYNGQPKNF